MKKKVSHHAKIRMNERFGDDYRNKKIKHVLMYGYTINDFKDELHIYLQWILDRNSNSRSLKVYDDMLVVYNKRTQKAITTWKIPDKFLPIERFR